MVFERERKERQGDVLGFWANELAGIAKIWSKI